MTDDIIATLYRSAGNGEVGEMWTETKSFPASTPVGVIVGWSRELLGRNGILRPEQFMQNKLVITENQAVPRS